MKSKQIAQVLGLVTALGAGCTYNAGYNALENALTNDSALRTRALDNIESTAGNVTTGHSGLNELTDGKNWYGENTLTFAKKDSKQSIAVTAKGVQGEVETMIGVRDTALIEMLGGYGFLSAQANEEASNLTVFYGKPLGKWSIELYHSTRFGKEQTHWTEVQANMDLGKHFAAFGRIEMPDFKSRYATYMLGITARR